MKSKFLVCAVAVTLAGSQAFADFTGYFSIPPVGAGGTLDIPPSLNPTAVGNWSFGRFAGAATVEFQRSPSVAPNARGFTLSSLGGAGTGGAFTHFSIVPPANPSAGGEFDPRNWCSMYRFNWSIEVQDPIVEAYWVDSNGRHDMNLPGQTGLLTAANQPFTVVQADPNWATYGFFLNSTTDTQHVLQIQGWQCVPEPSSVAMGLVVLLGIGGVALRRRLGK